MNLRLLARSLAVFVVVLMGPLANSALADDKEGENKPKHESYFAISPAGGLLVPIGKMTRGAGRADKGLAIDGRLAYVGSSGFGLDFGVLYTPLSRGSASSAMISLSAGPRYTLGRGAPRLWVSVGGGAVLEYDADNSSNAATVNAAAGLELHFFSNGGLAVRAAYARGFSGDYHLATVTGGLVFTL